MQFYRVDKKLSVKADLAIYGHVVDVPGQGMSVSSLSMAVLNSRDRQGNAWFP